MILFLNGAFGIGKTTVARALRARLEGSVILDPELIGIPLQRACRLVGTRVDDFQDLRAWRTLTATALGLARWRSAHVIVPMAISNPDYLRRLLEAAGRVDTDTVHVCLTAPLEIVHRRLAARGDEPARHAWAYRRAAECCAIHASPAFALQLDASERTPEQLADRLVGMAGGHHDSGAEG